MAQEWYTLIELVLYLWVEYLPKYLANPNLGRDNFLTKT